MSPTIRGLVLQDITWSTSKVLENAVGQAKRCGLDVADSSMLPCLRDIDTAEVGLQALLCPVQTALWESTN